VDDNQIGAYSSTIKLFILMRSMGFNVQILNEAKDKLTLRHTMGMFSSMLGTSYQSYPVAPAASTWPDRVMMGIGIIVTVGIVGLFIAGVWKCSLLLYACL